MEGLGAHTLVDTANYMLGILWLVPQEARVVFSARCSQSTKIGSGLVKVSPMKRRHTPPPLHLRLGSTPNAGIRRYEELGNVLSSLLKVGGLGEDLSLRPWSNTLGRSLAFERLEDSGSLEA